MRSIRSKVFTAILLIALTATLAVAFFSYRKSAHMIQENYTASLAQEAARTAEAIDRVFQGAYHTHIHAACDPELRETLLDFLAEGDEQKLEACAELLRTFNRQNASISSLYLLIPEANILVTSEDYPVYRKDVPYEDLHSAVVLAEDTGGPGILRDAAHQTSGMVCFSEAVEDRSGNPRAYLVSNIKERTLYYDYIARLDGGAIQAAVLTDRDGRVMTSLGQAAVSCEDWLFEDGVTGIEGEYLYSSQKAPFSQCRLLLVADRGVVLNALRKTQQDYAVILIMFLVISTVLASNLTGVIYRPLGKLTAAMREVSNGDLETRIEIASGDEIEVLAGEFNRMLEKIETLIQQLLDQEQKKKDAELEALQYQITPHFMYNTLNAIKCAALIHGERELGGVLDDFIENALFHGLDRKRQDGRLVIRAVTEDGRLYLCVQDNGRGMTAEQIDQLLHSEVRKTRGLTAVGVPNVRDRLALYYGDRAGLQYESGGTGTTAIIYLPAEKGGAE